MTIKRKTVATFDFVLKDDKGNIIDSSENTGSLTYLHGYNNIIPGLEDALEGKKEGEGFSVVVPPEKGYGIRDANMIFSVPSNNFKKSDSDDAEDLKPGMEFETVVDGNNFILTVLEVEGDKVEVDANHPLAGKQLHFDIKVLSLRESYSDELVQGFPEKK